MINTKDIKLPFKHCEAPQINWGADFDALDDKQKVLYMKKFSSSMNHAANLIQIERNILAHDIKTMRSMFTSAEDAVANQKKIMVTSILTNNAAAQQSNNEIIELKRQLKVYEDGNNS